MRCLRFSAALVVVLSAPLAWAQTAPLDTLADRLVLDTLTAVASRAASRPPAESDWADMKDGSGQAGLCVSPASDVAGWESNRVASRAQNPRSR